MAAEPSKETGCVTLNKLLNLSVLCFLLGKMGIVLMVVVWIK